MNTKKEDTFTLSCEHHRRLVFFIFLFFLFDTKGAWFVSSVVFVRSCCGLTFVKSLKSRRSFPGIFLDFVRFEWISCVDDWFFDLFPLFPPLRPYWGYLAKRNQQKKKYESKKKTKWLYIFQWQCHHNLDFWMCFLFSVFAFLRSY